MADGALIAFEVVAGQVANVHNTIEQMLLRRIGLVPYQFNGKEEHNTTPLRRKPFPTATNRDEIKLPEVFVPTWGKGEVRLINIPVTVVCIEPTRHLYAIEDLTPLESLKHSLESILASLKEIATRPRYEQEE